MADKNIRLRVSETGAQRTSRALGGVDNRLKSLAKSAAGVGLAYFGATGIINAFRSSIDAAGRQELAERKLETALGRTSKALLDQASALQRVTTVGDEAIIEQQAFLASLKFTESQIKDIITASIDLSAATGISLESAVRNTAKTFSGLSGELGELIPQLRDLTTEEMKAGDAVKVIADLFGGQAKAQTESLTGSIEQMKNAIGDAAESMGEILTPIVVTVAKSVKLLAEGISAVTDGFTSFMDDAKRAQQDAVIINSFKDNTIAVEEFKKQINELSDEGLFQLAESFNKVEQGVFNLTGQEKDLAEKQKLVFEEYKTRMAERKQLQEEEAAEAQFFSDLLIRNAEIQNGQFAQEIDIAEKRKVLSLQNKQFINESLKLKEEQIKQDIRSAAIQQSSAKDAMKAVIRAESMEAVTGLIASILKSVPFPFNTVLAAGAGATAASLIDKGISQFALGGDFITDGPQMIMVGDNAGGRERVQVTPLSSPNVNGPQEGISVNFNAPVTNDEYVRDFIIPEIKKATRMNLA